MRASPPSLLPEGEEEQLSIASIHKHFVFSGLTISYLLKNIIMPDIRHLVSLKSTPEKIYRAISTQTGIASWWSLDNNAKPEKGSVYRISFGGDYYKEIKITELVTDSKVVWEILQAHPEWLNTKVSFDISMGKNSTELRFSHSGWKDYTDMFAQCSYHWAIYLGNLKAYVEKDQLFALSTFF